MACVREQFWLVISRGSVNLRPRTLKRNIPSTELAQLLERSGVPCVKGEVPVTLTITMQARSCILRPNRCPSSIPHVVCLRRLCIFLE